MRLNFFGENFGSSDKHRRFVSCAVLELGQQINGVPIKYNQVEMQRYKDGKIVEWWVENDRLWMAEQLGMELTW